jgi:hypothetical protein
VLGFDVMYCKERRRKKQSRKKSTPKAEEAQEAPPPSYGEAAAAAAAAAADDAGSGGGGGGYRAHLLEVNCNPSLGVDSVYPCEGPAATTPVPPPASASWAPSWHEAMEVR